MSRSPSSRTATTACPASPISRVWSAHSTNWSGGLDPASGLRPRPLFLPENDFHAPIFLPSLRIIGAVRFGVGYDRAGFGKALGCEFELAEPLALDAPPPH